MFLINLHKPFENSHWVALALNGMEMPSLTMESLCVLRKWSIDSVMKTNLEEFRLEFKETRV